VTLLTISQKYGQWFSGIPYLQTDRQTRRTHARSHFNRRSAGLRTRL